MFLSKKNGNVVNKSKPTNETVKSKRMLGGWDDDEQVKKNNIEPIKSTSKVIEQNLLQGQIFVNLTTIKDEPVEAKQICYLTWDELDERKDIECQKQIIEEIVQPGGIRIKPSDNMLIHLLKESKGMSVSIIGSLLLSKLEANYAFQIKAKALYTIQYLIKKDLQYLSFYKIHADKIRQFPDPQDNVENYKKIQKIVLNYLGAEEIQKKNEQKQVFLDPGYNNEELHKSAIGNFIQQNAAKNKKNQEKRPIIGPGHTKNKPMQQQKPIISNSNKNFSNINLLNEYFEPVKHVISNVNLLEQSEQPKKQQISNLIVKGKDQSINLLFD